MKKCQNDSGGSRHQPGSSEKRDLSLASRSKWCHPRSRWFASTDSALTTHDNSTRTNLLEMNDPDTDIHAKISLLASESGATAAEAHQALHENGGDVGRAMSQLCYEKNHTTVQPDVESNITSTAFVSLPVYSTDQPTTAGQRRASRPGKCFTASLLSRAPRNILFSLFVSLIINNSGSSSSSLLFERRKRE